MKRHLLILALMLAALFVTNPDRDDFSTFVADHLMGAIEQNVGALAEKESWGNQRVQLAEGIAEHMTERKNFLLFSLYEIPVVDGDYRYIGIGTRFIPLQQDQPLALK